MMKTSTKKLSLRSIGALLLLFFASAYLKAQTPVSQNGQLRVCGTKLCNQYGNPIQLRGMSTHGIQWYGWGKCLTKASLDALAYDWGADILRISMYVQEGGYESNPTGFTNQVSTLINEATERGMYALVDFHQLTPGDPNYNLENAKRFFTDIANAHKNKNNIIYDICNEPNGVPWSRIKTYADQIIPVIRAIDPDAVILIGTHGWGSLGISDGRTAQDIVNNPVNFPNIMYTFHFYAKSHQTRYLQELDWASDRLPIFVTEFGTQEASGDGANDFTMAQKYIDLMRQKKISWINWNYSDDFRSGAVWQSGTCSNGPWTTNRLKPAGSWVRERMLNPADDFQGGNNVPPTVSISSPSNNATFTAGQTITITANASDADGSIASVEFFVNGASIGTKTSPAYSQTWVATAGTHKITARATDNKGASTTSAEITVIVNNVVTQSPYGGTRRPIPGKIEAEHYDLGGQGVAYNDLSTGNSGNAFRNDNVDIEECRDINGGYNVGWIQAGEWLEYSVRVNEAAAYKLNVRVAAIASGKSFHIELDGQNISGSISVPNTGDWQNWQTVTVNTPTLSTGDKIMRIVMDATDFNINYVEFVKTGGNQAPTVAITSPSNNATFTAGSSITINATASDPDGSVSKVEFFRGTQLIGTDISSPYSVIWTNATAGTHTITAV
ncbi:MAG TPA: cellulase family glycosylhydrolase, partial [Cytophagaceae bacterium]